MSFTEKILNGAACRQCGQDIPGEPIGYQRRGPCCSTISLQRAILGPSHSSLARKAQLVMASTEKHFQCSLCDKRFRDSNARAQHEKVKHGKA
jgi:hypothetical protein